MEPKLNVIDEKDGKTNCTKYIAFFIFDYLMNQMCADFYLK
jgi:hypothetical protein